MFFDCFALAIGLYAAVMAKWKPHAQFSYGYGPHTRNTMDEYTFSPCPNSPLPLYARLGV